MTKPNWTTERKRAVFNFIHDITKEIPDVKQKPELKPAIASHVRRFFRLTTGDAHVYVARWFGNDGESLP